MAFILISILLIIIILLLNKQRIITYFENAQEQEEIDFKERTNLDLWKLTKIYPEDTVFGTKQFFNTKPEFYYDDHFLYVIKNDNAIIKHAITDITEVTRSPFSRNDKRIWKIIINESGKKTEYQIMLTLTLSNNNFADFLDKVNENNESVVDSEWLL